MEFHNCQIIVDGTLGFIQNVPISFISQAARYPEDYVAIVSHSKKMLD
jgi:hypothetical protein